MFPIFLLSALYTLLCHVTVQEGRKEERKCMLLLLPTRLELLMVREEKLERRHKENWWQKIRMAAHPSLPCYVRTHYVTTA